MKKIIKIITICIFTCFSFYYTDKFISLSKEKDPIMIKINEMDKMSTRPVNGVVSDTTMFVGESGRKIDKDKTYEKMKKLGKYSSSLIEYVNIAPSISKSNNLGKRLEGKNTKKKEISFVFKLDNLEMIDEILYILEQNNIKTTFFIDAKLVEDNLEILSDKPLKKHSLGYYGYDGNYSEISIRYTKFLLNKRINISPYCLYKDEVFLKSCERVEINTISPVVIEKDLYNYIKQNKRNGYIYQIGVNNFNIKELNTTFLYLKQKGYNIMSIDELLKE